MIQLHNFINQEQRYIIEVEQIDTQIQKDCNYNRERELNLHTREFRWKDMNCREQP